MLNRLTVLIGFFCILLVVSVALGQNVEVLKTELKGVEGRLDAKIDGVKNELNASINGTKGELNANMNGVKGELNASINGVKSEVITIKWIIGGIGVAITIFLGFLGYLLNYFVKHLLPNIIRHDSRDTGQIEIGQSRQ